MADDPNEKSNLLPEIVLESPPVAAAPINEIAQSIFGEESIGTMTSKLSVVEAFLKVATRDIPFNDYVREMLMSVMSVIKCEAGSVFEVNQENNTLFFRAAAGRSSDQLSHFELPMGQGIVGHVAESRQPMMVGDVRGNHLHAKAIAQAIQFEAHSVLAVPILIRGRTYGVLELINRIGEPHFTPADLELLNYIGEMMARTVEIRLMINWSRRPLEHKDEAA